MFNQIFSVLGRRLSVFLCIISVLCAVMLVLVIGGLSRAFSTRQVNDQKSLDDGTHSAILLNPSTNDNLDAFQSEDGKAPNTIPIDSLGFYSDPRTIERKSYLNTKIVYKPYTVVNAIRKNQEQIQRKPTNMPNGKGHTSKAKSINSTTAKRITPSITDRVIADLMNKEYLASQQMQRNDAKNSSAYDDAIYIDADDGDEASTTTQSNPATFTTTSRELDEANMLGKNAAKSVEYKKTLSKNVYVGVRDKKSPKKPILIKHESNENRGNTDISGSSERFEYDDDDDDDDDDYSDFNSGSGDYNNNQYAEQNWRTTANRNADETKLKRLMFKHESNVEDNFGDAISANIDVGDEDDDSIESDADNIQQQKISAKIAYAHKKLMAKSSNSKNQKPMRKSKSNNANKTDKSNESNSDDWSASGKSDESLEQNMPNPNDWIEPRIRRILDNIKRSEERSQQILLCKGEGELCNILFKSPNRPADP